MTPHAVGQDKSSSTHAEQISIPLERNSSQDGSEKVSSRAPRTAQMSSPEAPTEHLSTHNSVLGAPFENQVKQILGKRSRQEASSFDDVTRLDVHPNIAISSPIPPKSKSRHGYFGGIVPTEDEGCRLLDVFISSMGVSQHFFDQRAFSDAMDEIYHQEPERREETNELWFVEFLLVMAIAKLVEGRLNMDQLPGASEFAEATRRMPDIENLRKCGVLAVEILALVAVYYKCFGQNDNAYIHIGLAVRISFSLGMHRKPADRQLRRSELTHMNRLMWTVVILDRRLAAATGYPSAVNDGQIQISEPSPCHGFPSPLPLLANIRIANVMSRTIRNLYGGRQNTERDCILEVQTLLELLHKIEIHMPSEISVDFAPTDLAVSRAAASLHLSLLQAIILVTRPVVLHMVQRQMYGCQGNMEPQAFASIIARLCQTCSEAALKSLRILSALKDQRLLAVFGHLDLDVTFSIAFILIMTNMLQAENKLLQHAEIHEAISILQHMENHGNEEAEIRRKDIQQMRTAVWPSYTSSDEPDVGENAESTFARAWSEFALDAAGSGFRNEQGSQLLHDLRNEASNLSRRSMPPEEQIHPDTAQQQNLPINPAPYIRSDGPDIRAPGDFEGLETVERTGILSMYQDPIVQLTGIDTLDWEQMKRVLLQ